MKAKGDLQYVADALDISLVEAEAKRTYRQFHFDYASPIVKAIAEGMEKAGKIVAKSSLDTESKQIVGKAVESLITSIPSLLVSGQNKAVIEIREIPRLETVVSTTSSVVTEEVSDV